LWTVNDVTGKDPSRNLPNGKTPRGFYQGEFSLSHH
jgi:hypothetical protein